MLETNMVEVVLVLDRVAVAAEPNIQIEEIMKGDLVFLGDKVMI